MRWPLVLATVLLCACTATTSADQDLPSTPSPDEAESARPTATPAPAPRRLIIAVAGDVHFEGALRARLDEPATALAPVTGPLRAADLAIVNLETSVGSGGSPDPAEAKRFTFQAPPAAFEALAEAGVDVATMANNHALDHGRPALASTFDAIDAAPLAVVGIGRDIGAAFAPALTEIRGTTVATIGATLATTDPTADPTGQWAATPDSPGTADAVDPRRLLRAVAEADDSAEVVVVYLHWGIQGESCPTDGQRALAARLVEAGADVVVGSHAHQLQGDGRLGRGYVAYGLGNYAWYTPTQATGVLTLTVRPPAEPAGRARVVDSAWAPAHIGSDGLPRPIAGEAAQDFRADLAALRTCAGFRG